MDIKSENDLTPEHYSLCQTIYCSYVLLWSVWYGRVAIKTICEEWHCRGSVGVFWCCWREETSGVGRTERTSTKLVLKRAPSFSQTVSSTVTTNSDSSAKKENRNIFTGISRLCSLSTISERSRWLSGRFDQSVLWTINVRVRVRERERETERQRER